MKEEQKSESGANQSATVSKQAETTGEDNVDAIDGCDIDIVEATPDEDLPVTKGGVG